MKLNWLVRCVSWATRASLVRRWLGNLDPKIESREKLLDRQRLLLESATLGLLFVHRRPLLVLGGHIQAVERPDMFEKSDDVALDRQPERQDLRATRPHLGTFDRVVVEEDEAVQPEVQLLRPAT